MRKHVQIVHEEKKHLMRNEEENFQRIEPLDVRSADRDRNKWFYTVSRSNFEFQKNTLFTLLYFFREFQKV